MLVELGNPQPSHAPTSDPVTGERVIEALPGPAVTYVRVPEDLREYDDVPHYGYDTSVDARDIALHLIQNPGPVTHLPGHEALLAVKGALESGLYHQGGVSWVSVAGHPEFQDQLAAFYGCASGRPDDLEDTHWTAYPGLGLLPPGVIPSAVSPLLSNTDAGRNMRWLQMLGPSAAAGILGGSGTATAATATSLTGSAETMASHASNDCKGMILVDLAAGGAYGYITGNTTGTTPVYTVDRWYVLQTPGGAAATTPGATDKYAVMNAGAWCLFMGISTNTSAVVNGDTSLASEITTAGGGLIRKIATIAHAAGATTGTVAATFTVNGSDTGLPVTIGKMGIGPSLLSVADNIVLTLLGTTAVLSAVGDNLTLTDTWTI